MPTHRSTFPVFTRSSKTSAQQIRVQPFERYEAVSMLTLRAEETFESVVVAELLAGTCLQILTVGTSPRRAHVTVQGLDAVGLSGWISVSTRSGDRLIRKLAEPVEDFLSDIDPGLVLEVKSMMTLREEESLDSGVNFELKPGTIVKIKEIGVINKRRAKVRVVTPLLVDALGQPLEGWVSVVTMDGGVLLGKVPDSDKTHRTSAGLFGSGSSKMKRMLEAARAGDLDGVTHMVEAGHDTGPIMQKLCGRVSVNCCDIRGKTPLIYAAAFGHKQVVDYILSQADVDASARDDTQKTALHHAAKQRDCPRKQTKNPEVQAQIVQALVAHSADMDATDHTGSTPLMYAAIADNEYVANVLVQAMADVNCKNYEGYTALDIANNFGNLSVASLLREAGADEDSSDEDGPVFVVTLCGEAQGSEMQVTCLSISGALLATTTIEDARNTTWKYGRLITRKSLRSHLHHRLRFVTRDGTILTTRHDGFTLENLLG